jgi:hypothetical protein
VRHTPVLDRCGISLVHGISDNVANVIDACLGAVERTIPWGEGPDGRRRRPCRGQPLLLAGMPLGMYHCEDCGEMVMAGEAHVPPDDDYELVMGRPWPAGYRDEGEPA